MKLCPMWGWPGEPVPSTLEGVPHENRVVPFRGGGEHRHRTSDEFLHPPHVLDSLSGQVRPGSRSGGRFAPALHILIDRLHAGLRTLARREVIEHFPVQTIAHADPQPLEPVEYVELREGDPVDAGGPDGLAHERRVEPAAAALAPRDRAEFPAPPSDQLSRVVVEFRWKRSLSDPGRV